MPKFLKIALKSFGIVLFIAILALILIPLIYKDTLIDQIKINTNNKIHGEFDFKDLNLSFFRKFPRLSICMSNPVIKSFVHSDTTTLLRANNIVLHLDVWNIISNKDKLDIKSFEIESPELNVILYDNGLANYDLIKDTTSGNDSEGVNLKLSNYSITNGKFVFRDSSSVLSLENLNHQGALDLNGNLTDMSTKTSIKKLNYKLNGITYLKDLNVQSRLDLSVDGQRKIYTLKKNELEINALKVRLEGHVSEQLTDGYYLDLKLNTPNTEFKELFSIIPGVFTNDYKNVKSSGSFNLDAEFKGLYNSLKSIYPSWKISSKVDQGSIQYLNMPVALNQVDLEFYSENNSPSLQDLILKIQPFSFRLNNNPVSGSLSIENIKSNPHIIGSIKGKIDLNDFKNFMPLEGDTELSGLINLEINTDFFESEVQNEQYDRIKLYGLAQFNNISYKSTGTPDVIVKSGDFNFTPDISRINNLAIILGRSDLFINATVRNPLALLSTDSKYEVNTTVNGNLFDANEFLNAEEDSSSAMSDPSSMPQLISRGNIQFTGSYNHISYDTYDISNIKANGSIVNSIFKISSIGMNVNGSNISGNLVFTNLMDYIYNNKVLNGNINLSSPIFNVNKFMQTEQANSSELTTSEPFLVPDGMNLDIAFATPVLLYDKLELKNFSSNMTLLKDEIQFKEITSSSMGGTMALSGIYNSSNTEKPKFDLKYDLKRLQFAKIFESIKTFRAIAPIAKYIEGQFNSSFVFSGSLGKDMSPDLSSINVAGIFETIDAAIKNYKPLEAVSSKLNIKELKNLSLKNTKNWFSVENGQVTMKELNYKLQDIDVAIAGNSKIQGPMDFNLKFKIPRSKLSQNALGQTAETGLNYLKSLGNKVGLNVNQGTHIKVMVNLKGQLLDPELSFKLLGSDGESLEESGKDMVHSVIDNAKDSIRKRGEQEVEKLKDKAMSDAQRVEDSLKAVANRKVEEEKAKILQKAENEANKHLDSNLVNKGKDLLKDKLGKGSDQILNDSTVDKIKDKMKGWNPFKKKQ